MTKTTEKPAPTLAMAQSQKRDMRFLDKRAPAPGSAVPPVAQCTMSQLFEVERLANIGFNLAQIGQRLRVSDSIWQLMVEHNPDIAMAYRAGFNRFQEEVLTAAAARMKQGEPALVRLAADRGMLGDQWKAPDVQQVQIVNNLPTVRVDVLASVDAAFARQRALIESDVIEADVIEVRP